MASAQASASQQPSSATWTEPPWCGWIETTGDALLILEAARRGLIPRVTRRLVDSERKMITSGSVFVFDEDESGIKRWTDGFFWSPSRILGNFLLYRETDKRGAGHRSIKADQELNGESMDAQSRKSENALVDKTRERILLGSLTNSYKFKPDGLMKKTFSLSIGGVAQHLISYYKIEDVENGRLRSPSSLPELASLDISPEYLDKTHFRNPPRVEIGVDGRPRYCGEAEDIDTPPPHLPASPLSSSMSGVLTDGRVGDASAAPKKTKRYDPYNTQSVKRSKKNAKGSPEGGSPTNESGGSPVASASPISSAPQPPQSAPPTPNYPDNHVPMHTPGPVQHPYPPYGMGPFYPGPVYHPPPPHMHPGAYSTPMGISPPNSSHASPGPPYPSGYPSYNQPGGPGHVSPSTNPMNGAGGSSPTAPTQTHGSDPSQAGLGPSHHPGPPAPPATSTSPMAQGTPGHMYHSQGQPAPHYAYYYPAPHPGYPPPPPPPSVGYQWPYPHHPPAMQSNQAMPGSQSHQHIATSATAAPAMHLQQSHQTASAAPGGTENINGNSNVANNTN